MTLKQQKPRLLIIGYVWPEPRSSAAGSRMLQLIEGFLHEGWDIVFGSAAQLSEQRADLNSLGVREQILALNCDSFDEFIKGYQPQAVIFDRFFTEEQFSWRVAQHCPDALRILDTEDLHSLRQAREQLIKTFTAQQGYQLTDTGTDLRTSAQAMANEEVALRELAAIWRSDLSLVISETEMQLLQQHFAMDAALLHYCPLLATPSDTPAKDFETRTGFISIGNFRHAPNWDAVLCLKQQLWPAIRERLPQAELHIYGAYLPPKASQLHNPREGFLIKGWAEDAQQVMSQARVCLAPLRFGAGIKGKLLDAMQAGTPSVTTSIGAEAMTSVTDAQLIEGVQAWPGAIANSNQDFVEAAVRLYTQQTEWQLAQQRGLALATERFALATHRPALMARLAEARAQLTERRQQNFIGRMLQHHLLKSTQYMAQWIAAKNRPR